MLKWIILASLFAAIWGNPRPVKEAVCGYASCPQVQPGKLNVHLVPHTHDDVGWLKTVDQYYYGSKSNIQNAGVQYILDSVVTELGKNPDRKFIYVETAFFWKWWVEQSPEIQEKVKGLVNNGQLEFIGGAWSMNDEATTHYQSTIDQFSWGLRKLNETFGKCGQPRVGWQIDPFGHSREQGSLMAQFHFDGVFFGRLDYQDKNNRLNTKTMEVIWEGSPSLGEDSDMFTHGLYHHYSTPEGLCWDANCGDDAIIDNPNLPDYNVPGFVQKFLDFVHNQQVYYRSENIIVLFGDDFQFKTANKNYKNIDKLIRYVNERQNNGSDVNVFYSTPSCYVKAVNEANLSWRTKQDDFFPYASGEHSYWTGYFTSRPTLKYYERQSNNLLQVAKQLSAITFAPQESSNKLDDLREAMGIMQHHDAITGTEKQAVANDYARILYSAVVTAEQVVVDAANSLLKSNVGSESLPLQTCSLRNISVCAVSAEKSNFLVTIYNPLSRNVTYYVRLPIPNATYTVRDPSGAVIPTQTLPIPDQLKTLPGRTAGTEQELVFVATNLPPLGYKAYYISKTNGKVQKSSIVRKLKNNEDVTVGDSTLSIELDGKTKLLKSITTLAETYDVQQSLQFYNGVSGSNSGENARSSGAYIFRPMDTAPVKITNEADTVIVQGDIVEEVHQVFSSWASQIIRHYSNQNVVEFEWLVGPIPVDDGQGREVISKFTTSIPTNGIFYTDANGREVLQRRKDYRPDWTLQNSEPVAGNYYPVVTDISIDNGTASLAIITDRAQGGSSLEEGSLELMVHRRLLHDDAFGVGEAINEQAYGQGLVARGRHFVLIGSSVSTKDIRLLEQQKVMDSFLLLADVGTKTFENIQSTYTLEYQALQNSLPDNVQILTLEPWKDGTLLLRLENVFTIEQDQQDITVNLNTLFKAFTITSARETTLAADRWLEESSRLQWKKDTNEVPTAAPRKPFVPLDVSDVTLSPKQIRTFVITVEPNKLVSY